MGKCALTIKKFHGASVTRIWREYLCKKSSCKLLLLIFYLFMSLFNLMSRSGSNSITLRYKIWGEGYEAEGRVVADAQVGFNRKIAIVNSAQVRYGVRTGGSAKSDFRRC